MNYATKCFLIFETNTDRYLAGKFLIFSGMKGLEGQLKIVSRELEFVDPITLLSAISLIEVHGYGPIKEGEGLIIDKKEEKTE